jgi:hypothetical protein
MKKFIFNNITIYQAWEQFIHDIGEEYELQGGKCVIIEKCGPLIKNAFNCLGYNNNTNIPDYTPNGELNLNKFAGKSFEVFGFAVTVKSKPDSRGYTTHNTEFIHVPYDRKEEKSIVETNSENTLIHNLLP